MSIETTFLRRCIATLEAALGEIEGHREANDVRFDIYRAAWRQGVRAGAGAERQAVAQAPCRVLRQQPGRRTAWRSRTSSAMPRSTG